MRNGASLLFSSTLFTDSAVFIVPARTHTSSLLHGNLQAAPNPVAQKQAALINKGYRRVILGLHRGCLGMMEKKVETIIIIPCSPVQPRACQ